MVRPKGMLLLLFVLGCWTEFGDALLTREKGSGDVDLKNNLGNGDPEGQEGGDTGTTGIGGGTGTNSALSDIMTHDEGQEPGNDQAQQPRPTSAIASGDSSAESGRQFPLDTYGYSHPHGAYYHPYGHPYTSPYWHSSYPSVYHPDHPVIAPVNSPFPPNYQWQFAERRRRRQAHRRRYFIEMGRTIDHMIQSAASWGAEKMHESHELAAEAQEVQALGARLQHLAAIVDRDR